MEFDDLPLETGEDWSANDRRRPTAHQRAVLDLLEEHGPLTLAQISSLWGSSITSLRAALRWGVDAGFLAGPPKWRRSPYRLVRIYRGPIRSHAKPPQEVYEAADRIAERGETVSMAAIGRELGVTRAAIWARLAPHGGRQALSQFLQRRVTSDQARGRIDPVATGRTREV